MSDPRVIPLLTFLAVAMAGQVLLWVSNRAYYMRTRDPKFLRRFWLYRRLLTKREYVLNRTGFVLCLASFVAMAVVWVVMG
jgi:hypothetical protein